MDAGARSASRRSRRLGIARPAVRRSTRRTSLLTVGAAAAIAQTGIPAGEQAIALAVFVVIGTLGVLVPLALSFGLGERSKPLLDQLRSWMAANNTVIMAVLFLIIGAKLLGDGISGL